MLVSNTTVAGILVSYDDDNVAFTTFTNYSLVRTPYDADSHVVYKEGLTLHGGII